MVHRIIRGQREWKTKSAVRNRSTHLHECNRSRPGPGGRRRCGRPGVAEIRCIGTRVQRVGPARISRTAHLERWRTTRYRVRRACTGPTAYTGLTMISLSCRRVRRSPSTGHTSSVATALRNSRCREQPPVLVWRSAEHQRPFALVPEV